MEAGTSMVAIQSGTKVRTGKSEEKMIGVTNKEGNTEKRDTGVSLSVGAAK
jgi:hypothetical protein